MTFIQKQKKKLKWKIYHTKFSLIALRYKSFTSKKGLFIDCGSNIGQGYTYFKKYFKPENFAPCLIEPNPNCMEKVKDKFNSISNIEFIQKAVWIRNEKLSFFGLVEDSRGNTSTGGSVVGNHNSSRYVSDTENAIRVDAFSFSDFLLEKRKSYKRIIVKMDIESAEYEVLENLIENKTIGFIDHLIVEFHSQYFESSKTDHYLQWEKKLLQRMKSAGVGVTIWV